MEIFRVVITWHLQTTSASAASMSTTFPLPSSPHCAPRTTVTLDKEPEVEVRCFFLGEPRFPSPFACCGWCCILGQADISRRFSLRAVSPDVALRPRFLSTFLIRAFSRSLIFFDRPHLRYDRRSRAECTFPLGRCSLGTPSTHRAPTNERTNGERPRRNRLLPEQTGTSDPRTAYCVLHNFRALTTARAHRTARTALRQGGETSLS